MSSNITQVPTVTKTTLAADTVTLVQAENSERKMIALHNEDSVLIWFAFAHSAPADNTTMEPLQATTGLIWEKNSGMPKAKLYAYSTLGGVIKTSESAG